MSRFGGSILAALAALLVCSSAAFGKGTPTTFRSIERDVECRAEGSGVLCATAKRFRGVRAGIAGGNCKPSVRVGSVELGPSGYAWARNICGPITANAMPLPTGAAWQSGQIGCLAYDRATIRCRSRASGNEMTISARSYKRRRESPRARRLLNQSEDHLLAEQRAEEEAAEEPWARNPTPGTQECGLSLAALCE